MAPQGLLFVISDVPSSFDEEFNAWYDTEHIGERLAVDGFLSAWRFVSAERPGRYLAQYELRDPDVLGRPAYLAVTADNNSAWTKRVLGRIRVDRMVGNRVTAGDDLMAAAPRLLVMRFGDLGAGGPAQLERSGRDFFRPDAGITQMRVFELRDDSSTGALLLAAGHGDLRSALISDRADPLFSRLDLVETFLPY